MGGEWTDSVILGNVGRQLGPFTDTVASADRAVLRDAVEVLSRWQYRVRGTSLHAVVDWQPYVDAHEREANEGTLVVHWTGDMHPGSRSDLTELLLYDAFICLNLAVPGSFTLYRGRIVAPGRREQAGLTATSVHLEDAWSESIQAGWPPLQILTLGDVRSWFDQLSVGTQQVATETLDKALFTLLHIANMAGAEPAAVMWIAQGLESLYAVPSALSKLLLTRRAAELLQLPPERFAWLRRRFNSFYDFRNAVVHGGAPVVHPIRQDLWDERVADTKELLDETAFGLAVFVATLQRFVQYRWRKLDFAELLRPERLP